MRKGLTIVAFIMASLIINSQNEAITDSRLDLNRRFGTEANTFVFYDGDASSADGTSASGAVHCISGGTEVVNVTNTTTGDTWMDRNLGAYRQAAHRSDSLSFGALYQWGRFADGHQCRNSNTTTIQSPGDTPGHGDFIIGSNDWRSTHNDSLWQGLDGFNNPCPPGYRVPTLAEWVAEMESWILKNATGAYASPLKIPLTGMRNGISGAVEDEGSWAGYWSSTIDFPNALPGESYAMAFDNFHNHIPRDFSRSNGYAVRCIKDVTVGVSHIRNSVKVKLFPNPAFSFVTVAYAVEESLYKQLSVVVHGSDGNKVIDQNLPGYTNEVIVDLKKLSSGIYTVSLMGDGQRIATKKLNLMD